MKPLTKNITGLLRGYKKGYHERPDHRGQYINVVDGIRYTKGSLEEGRPVIHMFEPCSIFGDYVKDEDTVASVLQLKVKNKYQVINRGNRYIGVGYKMRECEFNAGDIAVVMVFNKEVFEKME